MKLLIYGRRLCGRVDRVPGICYVATRFAHLYYVPLIPLSSWIIKQGTEKTFDFREQRIRLSVKSVLIAWLQAYLFIFGVLNSAWGGYRIATQNPAVSSFWDGEFKLILGLLAISACLMLRFRPLQAGPERTADLLGKLGMKWIPPKQDDEWNQA